MAHYQAIGVGGESFSQLMGGKENAEKCLKGMNLCKEITVQLGKEHNPPYVWNENIPNRWVGIIADAVIREVQKDKNWHPTVEFIEKLRQECNKEG